VTDLERIAVLGTSGSGKTATARQLASKLAISHVELDALHWEPDWKEAETAVMRQRVTQATSGARWVVDGNYSVVRDIVWQRATHLIWLDYPFMIVMFRVIRRTLRRVITQEELWHGNRERWSAQFLSKDSLFLWVIQTHWKHRRDYPPQFHLPEHAHLKVVHLRSPKQTDDWLAQIG